jgi:hypothetical protein
MHQPFRDLSITLAGSDTTGFRTDANTFRYTVYRNYFASAVVHRGGYSGCGTKYINDHHYALT